MTDMGRRRGDMLKSVYDQNDDGVADGAGAHKTSHQNGGADEISVAALSGELADVQPSTWPKVAGKPSAFAPSAHKTSHQNGGSDEIDCTGLAGAGGLGILGDGTPGRVLRAIFLVIDNGTTGPTLKCTVLDNWNGDTIAETDNIAKNATTGSFTFDAAGEYLTVECAGLSGNVLFAFGVVYLNQSTTPVTLQLYRYANDIYLGIVHQDTGIPYDITNLVNVGAFQLNILYITDA